MKRRIIYIIIAVCYMFCPVNALNDDSGYELGNLNIEVVDNKLHYHENRIGYEFSLVDNGYTVNMRGNRLQTIGAAEDAVFYPIKFTLSIPSKIKELYMGCGGELIFLYPDDLVVIISVDGKYSNTWFNFEEELNDLDTNGNTFIRLSYDDMKFIYEEYLGNKGIMRFRHPSETKYIGDSYVVDNDYNEFEDTLKYEWMYMYKMCDSKPSKKRYYYVLCVTIWI